MIAPLSWLKEYVDIDISAAELQEKLFSCGFEVEELTYLGRDVENVVTGKILATEKHPDADRLTVCKVDCGKFGIKQIVTAATNVFAGAIVPVALDNSTVKHEGGVRKIKTGKLRGVLSEGMFCSGEELGINNDFYDGAEVNGILILDPATQIGVDIRPVVGIDDYLFDIAVTANRPDCQSVVGMAREVAAVLKKPLRFPATDYAAVPTDVKISVTVREPALCPRYIGHYVKDVKIGTSPRWLRRRLALCGLRSVSDMVDITNYVLLEMGQPMHAFDRDFLRGGCIEVRRAEKGEKIVTLDKREFILDSSNLLICDGEGGVALAGIMGGLDSEIKASTEEVFFEAAKFARDSVRKTSRTLGQRSDSSARFEKGVDAWLPEIAINRALHLVEELGCGVPTKYRADANAADLTPKQIVTDFSAIERLLGIGVPHKESVEILTRLGFAVHEDQTNQKLVVGVPLWREDVDGYPDLAEEIIRMYGYEHIEPTFLKDAKVTRGGYTERDKRMLAFKTALKEEGFFEACNYSFYSPKAFDLFRLGADAPERRAVKILNPIGEDLSVMRTFLAPSMLENVVRNVRRGNAEGRLFELAKVYLAKELPLKELPEEKTKLVMAEWGGGFFDLKGAIEDVAQVMGFALKFEKESQPYLHPGISAAIFCGGKKIGWIGELHPVISKELAFEKAPCLLELDYDALPQKEELRVEALPAFSDVLRDIAFTVDERVTCAEAEECILRAVKAVKSAELFDVYRGLQVGKDKKSMAFRLTFAADEDKPLAPETVDGYFKKILGALKAKLNAELR